MRRIKVVAVLVGIGLVVSACPSSKSPHATPKPSGSVDLNAARKQGGTVTISNEQGQTWPCHFNPFNPGQLPRVDRLRLRAPR